jgi:hypothetical protein
MIDDGEDAPSHVSYLQCEQIGRVCVNIRSTDSIRLSRQAHHPAKFMQAHHLNDDSTSQRSMASWHLRCSV